ncbi:hypothetical protein E3N88_12728 [Mikania micrantha]|uniref:Uncharacterized protein n=1 Tax=Mikania micrantha TaxID=192012 RepID=A0A5N6P7N9_9ASTR|nr:hypothetical protein E3N88_12728 [Mikania micrantha]
MEKRRFWSKREVKRSPDEELRAKTSSPFVRATSDDFLNHNQTKPNKNVNFSALFQGPSPVYTTGEHGEFSGEHEDEYEEYEDYENEQFSPVQGVRTFGAGPNFATTDPYVPHQRNQHHREFPRPDIPYPQPQPRKAQSQRRGRHAQYNDQGGNQAGYHKSYQQGNQAGSSGSSGGSIGDVMEMLKAMQMEMKAESTARLQDKETEARSSETIYGMKKPPKHVKYDVENGEFVKTREKDELGYIEKMGDTKQFWVGNHKDSKDTMGIGHIPYGY